MHFSIASSFCSILSILGSTVQAGRHLPHAHRHLHALHHGHDSSTTVDFVPLEDRQAQTIQSYRLWTREQLDDLKVDLPARCINLLSAPIRCDNATMSFQRAGIWGWPGSVEKADAICTTTCRASLTSWFKNVEYTCKGYDLLGAVPELAGGRVYNGWNQTCLKDTSTGDYCGKIINQFTAASSMKQMPKAELCSFCWLEHFRVMQRSPYSGYDDFIKSQLDYAYSQCGVTGDTSILPLPTTDEDEEDGCWTGEEITVASGDTCDSLALKHHVASQAIYNNNPGKIVNCEVLSQGVSLCLPASCQDIYKLETGDTCDSIEVDLFNGTNFSIFGATRKYNTWVNGDCSNLHWASDAAFGHVLCMSPQNGKFVPGTINDGVIPEKGNGYSDVITPLPPNTTIAKGTTLNCGVWYTTGQEAGETCAAIVFSHQATIELFMQVNPSLGTSIPDCTSHLQAGLTYCTIPYKSWNTTNEAA